MILWGDYMEDTQKRNKRIMDWQKAKKDRIVILPDKADGLMIRQAAEQARKSITQYVIDKIRESP
jgi:uncharacterized protein (DUF1778 family)